MNRIYSDNFWHFRKQVNEKKVRKRRRGFVATTLNIYVVGTTMEIISVAWQRSI